MSFIGDQRNYPATAKADYGPRKGRKESDLISPRDVGHHSIPTTASASASASVTAGRSASTNGSDVYFFNDKRGIRQKSMLSGLDHSKIDKSKESNLNGGKGSHTASSIIDNHVKSIAPSTTQEPEILSGWEHSIYAGKNTDRFSYVGKDEISGEPEWIDHGPNGSKGGKSADGANANVRLGGTHQNRSREPEKEILTGWQHSMYAHKNNDRYAYIGKDEVSGEPEWIDHGPKVKRESEDKGEDKGEGVKFIDSNLAGEHQNRLSNHTSMKHGSAPVATPLPKQQKEYRGLEHSMNTYTHAHAHKINTDPFDASLGREGSDYGPRSRGKMNEHIQNRTSMSQMGGFVNRGRELISTRSTASTLPGPNENDLQRLLSENTEHIENEAYTKECEREDWQLLSNVQSNDYDNSNHRGNNDNHSSSHNVDYGSHSNDRYGGQYDDNNENENDNDHHADYDNNSDSYGGGYASDANNSYSSAGSY